MKEGINIILKIYGKEEWKYTIRDSMQKIKIK